MGGLKNIFAISLLGFLVSCGESNNFRLHDGVSTFATVEGAQSGSEDDSSEDGSKGKRCEDYDDADFYSKIDLEDILLEYDEEKVKEFAYGCKDNKVVVCHVPPGNPEASHFIKISNNKAAIEAHLNKSGLNADGKRVYSYLVNYKAYKKLSKSEQKKKGCAAICY